MYDPSRVDSAECLALPNSSGTGNSIGAYIERDVPTYLYKYTKRKFARSLVNKGMFRLGTILNYRSDKLCSSLRDEYEGKRIISYRNSCYIPTTAFLQSYDCWMFCSSELLSKDLLPVFKSDAIVKIKAREFFLAVAKVLTECSTVSLRKAQYLSEAELNIDSNLERPPLVRVIKPAELAGQKEWRMCFEPRADFTGLEKDQVFTAVSAGKITNFLHDTEVLAYIEPRNQFRCAEAAQYCSLVDLNAI